MPLLSGLNVPRFSQYTTNQFVGNGSQTTFTLSRTPPSAASLLVTIDGVKQHVNTYSIGTNQIIFTEAPPLNSSIECIAIGAQGSVISPGDNTVSLSTIVNGAVNYQKLDTANGDGTGAMSIPYGTTAQRPLNPQYGYTRYNTDLNVVESYHGATGWLILSNVFQAEGGSVTTYSSGGVSYKVHTFTSSSAFTVTSGSNSVDVLIVAGGGGGGAHAAPGGGGAGGLIYKTNVSVVTGTYAITVGAGGSGARYQNGATYGGRGGDSSAFSLTAKGGGAGVVWDGGSGDDALVQGGSSAGYGDGGGVTGGYYGPTQPSQPGDSGTFGFGNGGGDGYETNPYPGGGGGGAGAAGQTYPNTSTAGNGGIGRAYDITGSSVYYAGGGQGGAWANVTFNTNPAGGGGRGDAANSSGSGTSSRGYSGVSYGQEGTANTGGGGGGAGRTGGELSVGGQGGSGIVIVRYRI